MADLMPFLRGCAGVNVKVDPVRLKYDPQTGVQFLAQAVNVDIDDSGRISRRKGLRSIAAVSNAHSLWSTRDQSRAYVVVGAGLYSLADDGNLSIVKVGLTYGAKGYYAQVNDQVYFSNGYEKGIISAQSVWSDWVETPYVGPDTERSFGGPPNGERIAFYRGRMMIANNLDKCLYYSEPLNFGCFDPARGFLMFDSGFTMVAPVDDGVFVSTESGVFFLAGQSFKDMEMKKVSEFPAVPGTDVVFSLSGINPDMPGNGVCFAARTKGICLGVGTGLIVSITDDKVIVPNGSSGCSVVDNDFRLLTFMEI